MKNKILFFCGYIYIMFGTISVLSLEHGDSNWKTGIDWSFSTVFHMAVALTLMFQLDIILICVPLFLRWAKSIKLKEVNATSLFLAWGYLLVYTCFLYMRGGNMEGMFFITFLISFYIKLIGLLIMTFISVYRLMKTNYKVNYN